MSLIVKGAKGVGKRLLKKESVEDALKRGVKIKKTSTRNSKRP